jgi:2OG-Fe(II) oxygenase superfamily
MAKAARERLARLLAGEDAGAFSAQLSVASDALRLEVDGVGQVRLPVRPAQSKKLCEVARPAHFGHREETILDPAVRDTWEISPDLVSLGGPSWAPALERALSELADELGVAVGNRLEAELHALLVYGPGQFFAPHQDTEKNDAMIGTLTVILPSSHTGGEFIVEHGGQSVTYRSSRDSLSLVAFYADCLHQVTPVRTGYRVALTFNLLLRGTPATGSAGGPVPELAGCLVEHFSLPEQVRYGSAEPPKRLVYLLDHKYTERGLRWDKLKGADAERATLLRAAADQADCEAVLALAEIKETWDTEARKITYLIDSSLTLDWWTSPSGGEAISLHVRDAETCASTPTAELKPYQSEYTGYMGNWGGTKDRWYRRAAIVMWTRERSFAAQAEASGLWALDELRRLADAGELAAARAAAASVESFWAASVSAQSRAFEQTLNVAVVLDAPQTATMLLRPFRVEMLTPDRAAAFQALAGHYGPEWTGGMLAVWFGERSRAYHDAELQRPEWLVSLPGLCEALGDKDDVTRGLLTGSWRWLSGQIRSWLGYSAASTREEHLGKLGHPLAGLLAATAVAGQTGLRDEILGFLHEHGDQLRALLVSALRSATKLSAADRSASGLDTLASLCASRLGELIARPARAEDDWAITWRDTCGCELCVTFGGFLGDGSRRTLEWPLAEARRKHIRQSIRSAELPVRHEIFRAGSPYSLMLTKTDVLFERERKARKRAVADLAWLHESWPAAG